MHQNVPLTLIIKTKLFLIKYIQFEQIAQIDISFAFSDIDNTFVIH